MLLAATLLVSVLTIACAQEEEGPIVTVEQGSLRGTIAINAADETRTYHAFRGIPYAEPPVGSLRFQPPVRRGNWNGILDAAEYGSECIQGAGDGNEDCLFLNVFTSELPDTLTELLPVLVWIHGGAFIAGSGAVGPEYFLLQDIVFVSINYRLNLFGFFTTQDENADGNNGLKDQAEALRWIRTNIVRFGGDPERITIIGESAGGASIQHLIHSPLSAGLFAQAISHSGSTMDRWAFQRDPLEKTARFAAYFDIPATDTAELVRRLQEYDAQVLYQASIDPSVMGDRRSIDANYFVPSIERAHEGAFLAESPYAALVNGHYQHVPYISGYNTGEGSYALGEDRAQYDANYELLVPQSLNIEPGSSNASVVGQLVKQYFYGDGPVTDLEDFINNFTDEEFVRAIRLTIEHMKLSMPVYVYRFAYKGSHSSTNPGVGHGEELQYFFFNGNSENETDALVRQRGVQLWSNFIKTGNPTPVDDPLLQNVRWSPAYTPGSTDTAYLGIDVDLTPGVNPDEDRWDFWNLIFEVYGVEPYITY